MERKVIVVCCAVGFLGLLSAATGFAAEAKRIKNTLDVTVRHGVGYLGLLGVGVIRVIDYFEGMIFRAIPQPGSSSRKETKPMGDQVKFTSPDECAYPGSPALGLGLTAAVALMIAQIIINVATGCICCRKGPHQSNSSWTLALICFVVSWFTFVVAFLLFLTGAALNDQRGEENFYLGYYYCYVVKPGVFAGASVLSIASVVLGIVYYLTLKTREKNGNHNQGGIAITAQPQYPSRQQDPIFVHEDTCTRRQQFA
ncbi:hypothetical protein OROGR_025904 [Orobanche gracilis]